MSLSFDDKLLGEKVQNYCSSSEDESPSALSDVSDVEKFHIVQSSTSPVNSEQATNDIGSTRTGPKGVVADYRQFKKLEREKKANSERLLLDYSKKHSLSCLSYNEELRECGGDANNSEIVDSDDSDDEFLMQYRQNRMNELRKTFEALPTYHKVFDLTTATFVDEIDNTNDNTTVIVHIYEPYNRSCSDVNRYLDELTKEYPCVKFCRIQASQANLSHQFSHHGVPAILVYKKGELIGNLLSITRDLGEDFYPHDLENYLIEHGFLPDKTIVSIFNSGRK